MANTINVKPIFVNVTISDSVTVDAVKAKAMTDPNRLYMCSTGEIFKGNSDKTTVVQYSANVSDFNKIKTAVADIVASGKTVGQAITDAINKLDVAAIGGTGKVITTVSQTDGKIAATAIDLNAANVAATAIAAGADTVAVEGTTVAAQVASLGKSVKATQKAAATYSVKKVTSGLASNVKEAYQLVQTVDGKSTDIAVQIPIYKDQTLKSVELTTDNGQTGEGKKTGQFLKYTYTVSDGSDSDVYVDVSQFLVESEFKNGLAVSEGQVSVKVDTTSEKYLTVSANGVKVSGVDSAIKTAVDSEAKIARAAESTNKTAIETEVADRKNAITGLINGADAGYQNLKDIEGKIKAASTTVNAKTTGHVTVAVTKGTDGNSVVTVAENDIASAKDTASSLNNLLEIVSKLNDGTTTSVKTATNVQNNLKDLLTQLNDPASFWEDYKA